MDEREEIVVGEEKRRDGRGGRWSKGQRQGKPYTVTHA